MTRKQLDHSYINERNGSNKPDTLLLVGTVAMIVTCGMIFISVVLMGY